MNVGGGGGGGGASVPTAQQLWVGAMSSVHPRDKMVRFEEREHRYHRVDAETGLPAGPPFSLSVSGLVKQFFGGFDAGAVTTPALLRRWLRDPKSKYHRVLRTLESLAVAPEAWPRVVATGWALNGAHKAAVGRGLHRAVELELTDRAASLPSTLETEAAAAAAAALEPAVDESWAGMSEAVDRDLRQAFDLEGQGLRLMRRWITEGGALEITAPNAERDLPPLVELARDSPMLDQWRAWREDNKQLVPVRQEWALWSESCDLAGALDALFWDSDHERFVLVDWKCVAAMKTGSPSDIWQGWGRPPFAHLPDTNFGYYSLQQNLYAALLRRHYDVRVELMLLVQIHSTLPSAVEHIVLPMHDTVDRLLDARAEDHALAKRVKRNPDE